MHKSKNRLFDFYGSCTIIIQDSITKFVGKEPEMIINTDLLQFTKKQQSMRKQPFFNKKRSTATAFIAVAV